VGRGFRPPTATKRRRRKKRKKEKIVKSGDELKKYFIKLCKKNDSGMVACVKKKLYFIFVKYAYDNGKDINEFF